MRQVVVPLQSHHLSQKRKNEGGEGRWWSSPVGDDDKSSLQASVYVIINFGLNHEFPFIRAFEI